MDRSKQLLLYNNKDITSDVKSCEYNPLTYNYNITFNNGTTSIYNQGSIELLDISDTPNPDTMVIVHSGRKLFNIKFISIFYGKVANYWYIKFINGSERLYPSDNLKVTYSCLTCYTAQNCINYLKQISCINELRDDNGKALLQKQYEKLEFVGTDTVMACYINPQTYKLRTYEENSFIFPFGGNASQFEAVANALSNQVSIIQGPPGTGKTQTILNIIANLLIMKKNVQIVSNNNSAILNVLEKLSSPSYELDFLAAYLGRDCNKTKFINDQTGSYPDIAHWEMDYKQRSELMSKIQSHASQLLTVFSAQERIARARIDLASLNLEIKYFKQYCSEANLPYSELKVSNRLSEEKIMQLWIECCKLSEKERGVSLWFKIKNTFAYRILDWSLYKSDLLNITTIIQSTFYHSRQLELTNEIISLESKLKSMDAKNKISELTKWSMDYLRAELFERYGGKEKRTLFSKDDLWQCPDKVIKEYPIILSTTFSARSSLKDLIYDYIIMDEASQVDIATGALSLSCAKNAVIVGDLKQLPNIVKKDLKECYDAIFNSYKLPLGYSFTENSFLKSVCSIFYDAPQTLLREHYRCHPKIIGFCNQKFYNNELIIMTQDYDETDTLMAFKTVVGEHKRGRINQRQIDVTIHEVLPIICGLNPEDIGIIAPYRDQVSVIKEQLEHPVEVETVHKFQGREKDIILLTTVDDVVTDFSDDPYLLNVAISRAKKQLGLVVSGNEQPKDSNISDLISYIEYNNFEIIHSEIRSVFDLLYSQYTKARIAFLKKHKRISEYDSENLMYCEILDILERYKYLSLDVICHQPLNMIIKDVKLMTYAQYKYAANSSTHLDFLLYSKISRMPVLAIEVDGFNYHKPGTNQYKRDRLKDSILKLYGIPLLRFPTNGSNECIKIDQFLSEYSSNR
ncbi:MAG: AAA domain-containing protein [Defluviitaleaceae bacterium]|nr:AAA domain-containing protein [Defluviitaleaceae bacterium]